jgi:iron(II)-dependent oxidoreductase
MRFLSGVVLISMVYVGFSVSGCDLFNDAQDGTDVQMDQTSVWISMAGGWFDMGDAHILSASPVHSVNVPTFDITRTEVTVAQYAQCVTAGMCAAPSNEFDTCNWNQAGFEQHPINCVTWQQATDFCTWFGGRLLSESEWEYAARAGGDNRAFPWGMESPSCDLAIMVDDSGISGCGNNRTWPVCSKLDGRTDQGLCDMSGNVFEWIQDTFHSSYEGEVPGDGSAWEDFASLDIYRVVRGAAYNTSEGNSLHVASRANDLENRVSDKFGIRCGRTPGQ